MHKEVNYLSLKLANASEKNIYFKNEKITNGKFDKIEIFLKAGSEELTEDEKNKLILDINDIIMQKSDKNIQAIFKKEDKMLFYISKEEGKIVLEYAVNIVEIINL